MSVCWVNGTLLDKSQATISIFDHGVLYGDGVFEGIRFYNRRAFRLAAHLQRLHYSATALGLTLPYSEHQLISAINLVISKFPSSDGYIRLVITRGTGALGINPNLCKKSTAFIIADNIGFVTPEIKSSGARLIISSTRRLSPDGLDPRVKSLNYLNHILARMEANNANADEAILLNAQGKVTEGSSDNIFIVRNNTLLTPPVTDGALDGITREVIFELAAQAGIQCIESSLSAYDLYNADECFLTGTAVELIAVREIDGRKLSFCPGVIFAQLQKLFNDKILSESNINFTINPKINSKATNSVAS